MSVIDRSQSLFAWGMRLRQVGRMQIGRILGSVPSTRGSYKAFIDLLERCYFMRAELNALAGILIDKKVMTVTEWQKRVDEEMAHYFAAIAKDWPEIEFRDDGFIIKDVKALQERSTREGWPP
jgi:hypothetical protein